MTTARYRRPTT